jgi:AraC-like DNA-binding protein
MLEPDYLSLALVRLEPREKWVGRSAGLTFIFLRGGSGKCLWRKGSQPLEPGDVLVLNAASGGELKPATRRKLLFSCFSVNFEDLFPLFSAKEIPLLQGISDLFKGVILYPASRALATKCHRLLKDVPRELDLDHRGQLLRIAAAILSFEFKHAQPGRSESIPMGGRMGQIFDKLSAAEILTLPVTALAHRFNCSRRHLTRLFHQQFGCSVSNLRMEIRMVRAVSLLRNAELTIGEVALQSGFNHRGLFGQCFKRRFGSSPTQWQTAALKVESRRISPMSDEPNCALRTDGLCPWSSKPIQSISLADIAKRQGRWRSSRRR